MKKVPGSAGNTTRTIGYGRTDLESYNDHHPASLIDNWAGQVTLKDGLIKGTKDEISNSLEKSIDDSKNKDLTSSLGSKELDSELSSYKFSGVTRDGCLEKRQAFEVTYPGYDLRFSSQLEERPTVSRAVSGSDEDSKQLAEHLQYTSMLKCTTWLEKWF